MGFAKYYVESMKIVTWTILLTFTLFSLAIPCVAETGGGTGGGERDEEPLEGGGTGGGGQILVERETGLIKFRDLIPEEELQSDKWILITPKFLKTLLNTGNCAEKITSDYFEIPRLQKIRGQLEHELATKQMSYNLAKPLFFALNHARMKTTRFPLFQDADATKVSASYQLEACRYWRGSLICQEQILTSPKMSDKDIKGIMIKEALREMCFTYALRIPNQTLETLTRNLIENTPEKIQADTDPELKLLLITVNFKTVTKSKESRKLEKLARTSELDQGLHPWLRSFNGSPLAHEATPKNQAPFLSAWDMTTGELRFIQSPECLKDTSHTP
jgi:hypothetical protein